jgi:sulfoxide reductase heme-binding subunit YedZ
MRDWLGQRRQRQKQNRRNVLPLLPSNLIGAIRLAQWEERAVDGTFATMRASWQIWCDRRGRISPLRIVTLLALLLPLAKAVIDGGEIGYGARPINELIHRAGFWALVFLGLTLAVSPFRRILRYGNLVDIRRMLGVGSFCYIAAHLALFFADERYDLGKTAYEITHRWYLIVGATAWFGLAALAATSTDGMVRRLGGLRWRRLHQLVYAIALLALIHYFQQTKADVTVPTFAVSLFLWLLAYRTVAWWQGGGELSTPVLFAMTIAVSLVTFLGEAAGIAFAFHVSPLRVLETAFNFDIGVRPGWEVLGAGLVVVAIDALRSRAARPRQRTVAAE